MLGHCIYRPVKLSVETDKKWRTKEKRVMREMQRANQKACQSILKVSEDKLWIT